MQVFELRTDALGISAARGMMVRGICPQWVVG